MTPADIAAALVRTTLAASAAALAAWALLAWLRIDSPRIHRVAWLLVIAQGWLFLPLTIKIETPIPFVQSGATGILPARSAEQATTPLLNEVLRGREPFATSESPIVEAPQSQKAPDPLPLPIIAIASWLLGVIVLAAISLRRYLQVLRTLPLGSPPDEPTWQAEWQSALAAAKLRRRQTVDLRITAALGPLLHWAPWAYLILVPRTLWTTLASPERQAILRHELAHLRRHDLWKSLAIRILALPQWFNPLVWYAVRRFDEAAEWACDDAAAATVDSRLTFAASLLQSAEYAVAPYPASAPAARGVLTRRIHRLVSPRFKEESKMKLLIVPMLLAIVAAIQIVRIEQVIADEPQAAAAKPPAERALHRPEPPKSQEQLDFDRLTKEFEDFARVDYVIEPPDILLIESDKLLPKGPHRLETFDELQIRVKGARPEQPIDNVYNVDADGAVNLGPTYGRIGVEGRTIEEAEGEILAQLSKVLTDVDVSVSLLASAGAQTITGQHLVAMNGQINLGVHGTVYVAGMTLKEAHAAIELKLAEHLDDPKVSVDVLAYNSKVYYIITQGSGLGDDVTRAPIPFPVDGKENVAEALARAYDNADRKVKLSELASASLRLLRPAPNGAGDDRVYPIVWDPSTQAPTPLTNHGILPGDRIFIKHKTVADHPRNRQQHSDSTTLPAIAPGPLPRYGVRFDDAEPSNNSPTTPSASPSSEVMPEKDAELSVKRVGDSLLLVRRSANEKSSGEPSEDADMKLKISPRWLESHRRLQPYDTIKLRVARPHRPAYALTWDDVESEFTIARDGSINFGREQGIANVSGMSIEEARTAIERQLRKTVPGCKVQLELGPLASQKFFVSIQRPDGTEIAAGALPVDSSMPASFQLGGLRLWLGNVGEASWELAEPSTSSQDQTYIPVPGDRLVIKVPVDFDPQASRPLPPALNDESADSPGTKKAIARPFWIEVFGDVQVEPPQSKLPSDGSKDIGFVIEPRFLPNVRRHAAAP